MRPHSRGDYLTKLCPTRFYPSAAAPAYKAFLAAVLPDPAVAGYVRELSGYAVTGEVSDQTLHLFKGRGSNGKGVLLDSWVDVLGDGEYAATAPAELVADGGERLGGFERNVFDGMARFDPAAARWWADEAKKATGGKADFTGRLAKAEQKRKLLGIAKADPEEALGLVADRKGREGFEAVYDSARGAIRSLEMVP